eukprot:256243-Chlamydomonas_euryale.AAC.1
MRQAVERKPEGEGSGDRQGRGNKAGSKCGRYGCGEVGYLLSTWMDEHRTREKCRFSNGTLEVGAVAWATGERDTRKKRVCGGWACTRQQAGGLCVGQRWLGRLGRPGGVTSSLCRRKWETAKAEKPKGYGAMGGGLP